MRPEKASEEHPKRPLILVVDDEQTLVDTLEYNLRREGYGVITAGDGAGAIKLARERRPDLIILDVMLPDINGQAVCELIRKDPTMAEIKIICISGMVEEEKIAELRASGADDFLHKPLDIDELIRRVSRLLDIETGPTG